MGQKVREDLGELLIHILLGDDGVPTQFRKAGYGVRYIQSGDNHADDGRIFRREPRSYLESIHLGHLQVEKNKVRMKALNGRDRFCPISSGAYDFDGGFLLQARADRIDRKRRIIRNYGSYGLGK